MHYKKKLHEGLIVYNTNVTDAPFNLPQYGAGNYVWDGKQWIKILNPAATFTLVTIKCRSCIQPQLGRIYRQSR